jgi:hypothetical protein
MELSDAPEKNSQGPGIDPGTLRLVAQWFIYHNQLNTRRNIYITVQTLLRHVSGLMCHLQGLHVPSLRLVTVDKI